MRAKPAEIANVFGLEHAESITLLDLAHRCEEGLPKYCFQRVSQILVPEGKQFLESLISPASLGHRKLGKLTPWKVDCIVRLTDCWLVALSVFQDEGKAKRFLTSPHAFLAGRPALQVAAAYSCGAQVVDHLLGGLRYGSVA